MNKTFKKIISLALVITIFFSSSLNVFAEMEATKNPIPTKDYKPATSPGSSATSDFLECSVSGILANILKTAIIGLINQGVSLLGGLIQLKVPTSAPVIEAKDAAVTIWGIPILPSWDAFGYCIVNATIAYLADATIYWIRSGFEGNPAFVDNPEKFFRQVADLEYEDFMDNIAAELACDPFRVSIVNSLATSYNGNFNQRGKCTLYDGDGNVDGFLAGDFFDFDVYYRYTQNPANNPLGSAIILEQEMNRRIASKQNNIEIEINWGKGFLPWKDKEGNTISPGTAIQTQVEQTFGIPKDRLILADEFDEVLTELVNYLVKFALDETLGALNGI